MRWKFLPPANIIIIARESIKTKQHTSLSNNTRVTLVYVQVGGNVFPELLKDESTSGEVKGRELRVSDHLADNLSGRTGDELDDTGRQTSLFEDFVDKVVRVGSSG